MVKAVKSQAQPQSVEQPAAASLIKEALLKFKNAPLSLSEGKKSAFAELKTNLPNIKILRVKTARNDSLGAYIALEGKRKGVMIRSLDELESLLAILQNPKLRVLLEALEAIEPKSEPKSEESDDVLELE